MKVKSPHRKVVLWPLKSRLYHTSSDCKRMVPASTGANELGVCVTAPAMLISDEIYFLNPGKTLHPLVEKQINNRTNVANVLKVLALLDSMIQ